VLNTNLRDTAIRILKETPRTLGRDVVNVLARYNRITGSSGLLEAVSELKNILENAGLPARVHVVENNSRKGFIETPAGWDPVSAEVMIKIGGKIVERLDLAEHPTLLSAHSPGGEGCGRLTVCEKECSGEAVLTSLNPYDAYKVIDARLILHYDKNRFHEAVPYTGLFLQEQEVKHGKVVMNIPYRLATELMSRLLVKPDLEIEVCWKAEVRYHSKGLPILVSCGDEPSALVVSHVCHPKPGAHDNASGSATNYLAAFARNIIGDARLRSLCHVWVPEYTGSVFLEEILGGLPEYVINLDMVGSKQSATGSVLSVVNPPLFMPSEASAALYISAKSVLDTVESFEGVAQPSVRYDVTPYSAGSDHDVFIAWGVDSGMLNEWPSRFYHTDMDSPDTISPSQVANIATITLLSAIILGDKGLKDKATAVYRAHLKSWYQTKSLIYGRELTLTEYRKIEKPALKLASPISTRFIYKKLGREAFYKVRGLKGAYTYLTVYAPLSEVYGISDHLSKFISEEFIEWSREEIEVVSKIWEGLKTYLR
jgi:hypothetical protein